MTSLSQQLENLATPQTNLYQVSKKCASILFSASEAENYSRETIYQISIGGFNELVEINDQFIEFRDSLFGLQTKEFQRAVETKEANEELDKTIEKFLLLLSPYLQKQASLKALEWLINRFMINEMNINSLMMCILPYYETILFARILQVINIKSKMDPWSWLKSSQKEGRPISKHTVFQHWASDQGFRNFISMYFLKMLKVHKMTSNLQVSTSLFMSTIIGGLSILNKITEDHISSICFTLEKCLTSKNIDVLSGIFIVLSQLCISIQLSGDLIKKIVKKLVNIRVSEVAEQNALCILTLFYHQEAIESSYEVLVLLEDNETLLSHISKLSIKKPVSHLLNPYITQLLRRAFLNSELTNEERMKKIYKLVQFIQSMPLQPQESSLIIRCLISGLKEGSTQLTFGKDFDLTKMMKNLENNHPEGFDDACTKIMENFSPESVTFEQEVVKSFRKKWVLGTKTNIASPKAVKKKNSEMKEASEESRWLECLKSGKLTQSSVNFLKKMCQVIQLPEEKMNSRFWQINGQDDFAESLRLLIKLVKVIVAHQIKNKSLDTCDNLLKIIFNEKLGRINHQIYFLSMIWGWNLDLEDVGIDRCLKLWALNFTSALLSSPKSNSSSLSWVLDSNEPLIPSLIIPICEGQYLCAAAFKVFKGMQTILGGRLRSNNLSDLVEVLVLRKEEILADVSYLPSTISGKVSEKKGVGTKITESLLACVMDDEVPLHIKSSVMYALSDVQNSEILEPLIPLGNSILDRVDALSGGHLDLGQSTFLYYILLRICSKDAVFLKVKGGWEFFQRSLGMYEPVLKVSDQLLSPQEIVLNYKLLQELTNSNKQLNVLEALISRIVKSKSFREASKLSKELKKINLSATKIIALWNKLGLVSNFRSVQEARAKKLKLQKLQNGINNLEEWRKFEFIVELIGVMEELQEPWELVGPICDHLQELLKMDSAFVDTLQQQMLSVCHHLLVLSKDQLQKEEFSKKCKLNIALIVKCIRTSTNPDTHRRALLILSLASSFFPEQVLHNIMAIFTFMGTSLLRRDDAYSFHIIHLTISSIVPTLIQAESNDPKLLLKKLSQVTQVFVDALPDLAEHRRLPLFTQLATTLGVSSYLWLVMVQIADAYVSRNADGEYGAPEDDEPRRLPRNIEFALVLYSQFSVVDQLQASREVINFVVNLPESKESVKQSDTADLKNSNPSTLVINVQTKTSRQLRQVKYTCLGLLVQLLSSERFVGQVYEFTNENSEKKIDDLKNLYKVLLETSLSYLKEVSQQDQSHKGQPTGRFWTAMQRKLMDLVDAINSLLPSYQLIAVISELLLSESDLIRCRAMEIMASKLHSDSEFFTNEEAKDLTRFIDPLLNVAMNVDEAEGNKQTALFTLQLLVRRLNSLVEPECLTPILGTAVNLIRDSGFSPKVTTQAALVIAESVHALKLHSLVHLNKLVPALLQILENSVEDDSQILDNLIIAAATAILRIAENVPKLLPHKELKSLIIISCRLISNQEEEGFQDSKLSNRLSTSLQQLVQSLELRVLIPTLSEAFVKLESDHFSALPTLMSILETLIDSTSSSDLTMFKDMLISLFVDGFDLRTKKVKENIETVEQVESCVIAALIRFLLKLNEDDNVTIVTHFLSWSCKKKSKYPARLITFFRFTSELARRLKVLFIKAKLSNIIFNQAAETLDSNNNLLQTETVFGKKDDAESSACILIRHVLGTLFHIFLYDSVQFTTDEKFNIIVEPLTNQIENTIGSDEDYRSRILNEVKPCIINFTKAVGDDTLWKELNRQILLRVRTENKSKVILGGLEVFEGLVETLGEDYLQPLLADTIPCIIEVLESLDEDVERKTKEIFNKMEAILGDSLRAYLDG